MRKTLLTAVAALALTALPATAQVVDGQAAGQIGGQVTAPPLGSTMEDAAGLTGDTVRDASRLTRDTAQDAQDTLGQTPDVEAEAAAEAEARAVEPAGAAVDLDIQAGAMVHASDGAMLGHVVDVIRDSAGGVQSLTVRAADGAARTIPAAGASVEGGAVVVAMTEAQFEATPQ